jgi:uncharacterized protein YcbK (DUF882 family)
MGDLSNHFDRSEFACPCGCGKDDVSPELVQRLERLRIEFAQPIVINSGVRCPAHNAKVGGVPDSAHVSGEAADLRVHSGAEIYKMLDIILFRRLFRRIGVGKSLIHVDVDSGKPQDTIWVYPDK